MSNKVVIVGGVAGGASCAARLRRLDEEAEVVVFERGPYVSFANCGLPYHVGGAIPKRANLLVVTPELLRQRFRIDIRARQEVVRIDRARQQVQVTDLESGRTYLEGYDYLVLAPGRRRCGHPSRAANCRGSSTCGRSRTPTPSSPGSRSVRCGSQW